MKHHPFTTPILLSCLLFLFWVTCTDPVQPPPPIVPLVCETLNTEICFDDTTECCCIENSSWNEDSTACECDDLYELEGDSICTLITTEHGEIFFEYDTLGLSGFTLNNRARAVKIIDEDNYWIVGQFFIDDSTYTYPGVSNYNAVHYLEEYIPVVIDRYAAEHDDMSIFSENEIWFTDGCFINYYLNRDIERVYECDYSDDIPWKFKHMWGDGISNVFFAGNNGSILKNDGTNFTLMASHTNCNLWDIWGVVDEVTGEYIVWACGYIDSTGEGVILKMVENEWVVFNYQSDFRDFDYLRISGRPSSVWTDSFNYVYVLTHEYLYKVNSNNPEDFTRIYIPAPSSPRGKMRGRTYNDIYFVGSFGEIWHYNGQNIHRYTTSSDLWLENLDIKNDLLICIGTSMNTNQAIVVKGNLMNIQ